jgi:HEAT repeat protein
MNAARPSHAKRIAASFRELLSGGDRRSVAKADRVLDMIRADRTRVPELVELAQDRDWLVSMRAMDLLEKLAQERPDWIAPHKRVFISDLADSDKWEIRLQIVRALPLFRWKPDERRRAVEILLRDIEHPQKFVKAWALDSLATLAQGDATLMPAVSRSIREFERSGSRALASRARHVRRRLSL